MDFVRAETCLKRPVLSTLLNHQKKRMPKSILFLTD